MPSTFIRSVSGLLNFHRFVRASYVVFCEGGAQNIGLSAALSGTHNEAVEDRTFWDALLRAIGFRDVHLKPLGAARHVLDVADYIIANNIPNNLAVIDRDFPGRKRMISDHRVLYSYGYSWENDVVTPTVVGVATVSLLHLSATDAKRFEIEFAEIHDRLLRLLKWPIFLQLKTANEDCDFVPTDNNLGGCILGNGSRIELNSEPLYHRIRRNKHRFSASATTISAGDIRRHIPGHSLMGLAYNFTSIKSRVRPALRPSRAGFVAVMLQTFTANPSLYLSQGAISYYNNWARGAR